MSVTLLEYMLTVNVALNKPTYLLKPFNDASNAVNGYKPTLSSSEAECVFSYPGQIGIWWVNLTNIYSFHHITIYFLAGNDPWGIVTFTTFRQ